MQRLADATAKADAAAAEQRRLLVKTDGSDAAAMKRAGECRRKTQVHGPRSLAGAGES
ncbi:hypothetical protein [Methylobacterium oxalidis]|uniref:hypothetical protein n=1 Tax=Methylobacterium oxalidis TaxID=944322 RepID=UPI0033163E10